MKKLTVTILTLHSVLANALLPALARTTLLASTLIILASTLLPLSASAQKDNLFPAKDWINFQWEEVTIAGTHFLTKPPC